jgi:hypothetical protein
MRREKVPKKPGSSGDAPVQLQAPHIGAFVLETLTLGMYGDPRHTLREYIQNSFDAIRAAREAKYLSGPGRVDITFSEDAITIRDNGSGVPADPAWKVLTSVGASKKDRQRDAGFRGIGRLAGMAYCKELIFETTFPGETIVTTVSFDCDRLITAMSPDTGGDTELSKLLATSISFEQTEGAALEDHYFKVTLQGLERAPPALLDVTGVGEYLGETAPVAFNPTWTRRASIEAEYKKFFGTSIETIDVFVGDTQIFKHFGDSYEHRKGEAELERIEFYSDDQSAYWGWVGRLSEPVAVTDRVTRGLRMRVRNIQVDGTDIFENLFSDVKPSYSRFSAYYVGEFHIAPDRVVPNARRDGFEETEQWLSIKSALSTEICEPLAQQAYKTSRESQTDVDKIIENIGKVAESADKLAMSSRATYDQVVNLMAEARRWRKKANSALRYAADLDATSEEEEAEPPKSSAPALQEAVRRVDDVEDRARMLIGRFIGEDDKIEALKSRIREEIVQEVLALINPFVDPATYQKIRQRLKTGG